MSVWSLVGHSLGYAGPATTCMVGVAGGYRNWFSPHTRLEESLRELEKIKLLLETVSLERRDKIDIATEDGACKGIALIEQELDILLTEYSKLSALYAECTLWQRHSLTAEIRAPIKSFETDVKALLKDTCKTTSSLGRRPGFPPLRSPRTASLTDSEIPSEHPAAPPDGIPMEAVDV